MSAILWLPIGLILGFNLAFVGSRIWAARKVREIRSHQPERGRPPFDGRFIFVAEPLFSVGTLLSAECPRGTVISASPVGTDGRAVFRGLRADCAYSIVYRGVEVAQFRTSSADEELQWSWPK